MVCVCVVSRFERPDLLVLRSKQTNFIMQKKYKYEKVICFTYGPTAAAPLSIFKTELLYF